MTPVDELAALLGFADPFRLEHGFGVPGGEWTIRGSFPGFTLWRQFLRLVLVRTLRNSPASRLGLRETGAHAGDAKDSPTGHNQLATW